MPKVREDREEYQRRRRERRGDRHPVNAEDRCESLTLGGRPCPNSKVTVTLPVRSNGEVTEKRVRLKTCLAHAPEKVRRAAGFMGHGLGGRKKKPPLPQVMREMVEQRAGEVMQPYFDGLTALRPVVVGNGPHARLRMVEDPSVRLRAADAVFDRVYGKPKQTTELTGADGAAIAVHVPSQEERAREVAGLLEETGAVRSNGHKGKAA
jgi:hypothetical protein